MERPAKLSGTAVSGALIGGAAVFTITLGVTWVIFTLALGLLAIAIGLISRGRLRRDKALAGVPLSMLSVLLGAVAVFFSAPAVILTVTNQF